jgi:hypothetical protein
VVARAGHKKLPLYGYQTEVRKRRKIKGIKFLVWFKESEGFLYLDILMIKTK